MSKSRAFDVAVVGNGPAGHAAALMMQKLGLNVVLIGPETKAKDGRTTALLGSSVGFMETLALWDGVRAHAQALKIMRLIDDTGRLFRAPTTDFDSSEIGLSSFGYNIANAALIELFKVAVAEKMDDGLEVIERKVRSIATGEEFATIKLEDGSEVQTKLCIAADGRQSLIREAAGIAMRNWSYPQAALVVNLRHASTPHKNISTEFHTPTGPFTLVPYQDGYCSSLVCVVTPEEAKRLMSLPRDSLAFELERRAHSLLGCFELLSEPQSYPLSGMVAQSFSGKRTALIAESAHVFPPIGAQGLNLSLRDITALVQVIKDDDANDPGAECVLAAYDKSRRTDVWSRTAGVHVLNMSLLSSLPFGQGARTAGLAVANMVPSLKRFMMKAGLDAPGSIGASSKENRDQN